MPPPVLETQRADLPCPSREVLNWLLFPSGQAKTIGQHGHNETNGHEHGAKVLLLMGNHQKQSLSPLLTASIKSKFRPPLLNIYSKDPSPTSSSQYLCREETGDMLGDHISIFL